MAKIKSLLTGFYADRPGFFLACTRFFFMFLFWIAFYLAAFTLRGGVNGPGRFTVADFENVGKVFVFIWWVLILLFVAFSLLKNAKTVKIVAIVQLAFIVVYLGMVMITFGMVQDEIDGLTGITVGYSFGFWLMLILLGLLVISVFFTQLIEKVIAKLVPPQILHPEAPATVAAAPVEQLPIEPQPVAPPPVEPAPIEPTPVEPEPIVEKPAAPTPAEPPLPDPVHFEPTPVEPIQNQPVIVAPTPIEPTPAEPAPVEPKPES